MQLVCIFLKKSAKSSSCEQSLNPLCSSLSCPLMKNLHHPYFFSLVFFPKSSWTLLFFAVQLLRSRWEIIWVDKNMLIHSSESPSVIILMSSRECFAFYFCSMFRLSGYVQTVLAYWWRSSELCADLNQYLQTRGTDLKQFLQFYWLSANILYKMSNMDIFPLEKLLQPSLWPLVDAKSE